MAASPSGPTQASSKMFPENFLRGLKVHRFLLSCLDGCMPCGIDQAPGGRSMPC